MISKQINLPIKNQWIAEENLIETRKNESTIKKNVEFDFISDSTSLCKNKSLLNNFERNQM